MGQREGRSLQDGNQVAAEALDKFERNCSANNPSGGKQISASNLSELNRRASLVDANSSASNNHGPSIYDTAAARWAPTNRSRPLRKRINASGKIEASSLKPTRKATSLREGDVCCVLDEVDPSCSCFDSSRLCCCGGIAAMSQSNVKHCNFAQCCCSRCCTDSSELGTCAPCPNPNPNPNGSIKGSRGNYEAECGETSPDELVSGPRSAATNAIGRKSKNRGSAGAVAHNAPIWAQRYENQVAERERERARHLIVSSNAGMRKRGRPYCRPAVVEQDGRAGELLRQSAPASGISSVWPSSSASTLSLLSAASRASSSSKLLAFAPKQQKSPHKSRKILSGCHEPLTCCHDTIGAYTGTKSIAPTETKTTTTTTTATEAPAPAPGPAPTEAAAQPTPAATKTSTKIQADSAGEHIGIKRDQSLCGGRIGASEFESSDLSGQAESSLPLVVVGEVQGGGVSDKVKSEQNWSIIREGQTDKQQAGVQKQSFEWDQQAKQDPEARGYLVWNDLALKYGRMPRKSSRQSIGFNSRDQHGAANMGSAAQGGAGHTSHRAAYGSSRTSCLCHILGALLRTLFPILDSLKNYSLPGDLATDMAAGFTVAVLHIPQGMAYGLLSGVEPIHGLYVSFIPVLVMSFMSRSRHVSYGTFAVISMLLSNTVESVRENLNKDLLVFNSNDTASKSLPLVLTNNHQPIAANDQRQHLFKSLARKQLSNEIDTTRPVASGTSEQQLLVEAAALAESLAVDVSVDSLVSSPPTGIEILACACLVCGILHVTMSLMRLGVLSLMFSDQLVSSFTTASAIHVLTSQLAGLFDLNFAPIHDELFKIVRIWWQFGRALLFDTFNPTTALLSLSSIMFLLLVKQLLEPALRRRYKKLTCLPSELFLMALVIICSWHFKFETQYNVKIIGFIPTGLPEARVPRLELVPHVLKDALTIALISFAMNLSIAQVYAKRFRYELDANQELFAIGTANIVGSFFNCFPCASSLSRSSVQSGLNVRSQLCSLFSCAVVVLIICFFAHFLHNLPRSTLSCIIVVALKGILMQLRDFYDNWRLSKLDALVWIITFLSVIIFGVTYGLILGIIASLFMIFLRLLTPNHSILGRLPDTEIYVDINAFADCEEIDRVKIFRFNSALCYLNRTQLKAKIEKLLPAIYKPKGFSAICAQFHQRSLFHEPAAAAKSVNFLIIDCSALSYCDYSGAATLVELIEDLEREKVFVYLAACPLKLIDMLGKMNSTSKILCENVYPTISDAIGQVRYLLSSRQSSNSEKDTNPLTPSSKQKLSNYGSLSQQTESPIEPGASSILDLS